MNIDKITKQQLQDDAKFGPIKRVEIGILWKRSRNGEYNPKAQARVLRENKLTTIIKRASGCGCDKLSSVVADILNECLLGELSKHPTGRPYGCRDGFFEGAVGIDCYVDHHRSNGILQHIGYSCEHTGFNDSDFILIERKENV